MTDRISARTREALGRLAQVVSCADRALARDVTDQVFAGTEPPPSPDEECVNPRRDPFPDRPRKSLLLRIV
jgi:hypothetical protein